MSFCSLIKGYDAENSHAEFSPKKSSFYIFMCLDIESGYVCNTATEVCVECGH